MIARIYRNTKLYPAYQIIKDGNIL